MTISELSKRDIIEFFGSPGENISAIYEGFKITENEDKRMYCDEKRHQI